MTAALLGIAAALGWGCADFIARYTGRGLGPATALFGMLAFSALLMSLGAWAFQVPLVWDAAGWWLLVLTGLGVMLLTLLLYWGLARGPVTMVAPIVGSYPAFSLIFALLQGIRPGLWQWLAFGAVMAGVILVSRAGNGDLSRAEAPEGANHAGADPFRQPRELRKTLLIAFGAALVYAMTVEVAQEAGETYGEVQTVWMARWISLLATVLYLLVRREPLRLPRRWWPLLLLQGVLDAAAYTALVAGGSGAEGTVTAVVGSAFCAVTVLLARAILKEAVRGPQWVGIVLIVAGVATLSAY